ncbi:coiled-coil domain-containing protein 83-like [Patiria miniata]|uniref:Coiled-coil domain-containing protein 83 n=1 Tax=Patiria miniata TaxID=46514 RepID=A0A914A513_PATMI|nr:coiled-coil domain-containing protein 83-like [Patiria miniata]XP_038058942.1 coiled-coil domain-containing protein 83-like [Patiria miniata]
MGKKGKKKGSGKKSGKKGGKKKSSEPQMTIQEAILAYQINIKEEALEEFMYEIKGLEEKSQKHKERNERLKEEQLYHIRTLLKQAKERDKELEQVTVVNKEHVEDALKEKWQAAKEEDQQIEDLKRQIAQRAVELEKELVMVAKWKEYKDKGQHEHAKHIKILEQELLDMQVSFDEMKAHLERTLNVAKDEIHKSTEERLMEQKHIASEKAMTTLDKWSTQEVKDNKWLKKEAELHRVETKHLVEEVEALEKENLEIMSGLFDCRIEDLKISRNFYLTQFGEGDDVDDAGILEEDLAKMDMESADKPLAIGGATQGARKAQRPKSATQRAVEAKVFSLAIKEEEEEHSGPEEDDDLGGSWDHGNQLDNYLDYEDENFDDYLNLGPVELKLLRVTGHKMTLIKPKKLTDEEEEAKLSAPDVWPVTPEMLKTVTDT